jgi:phospholipase/carboxylesterase
MSKDLFPVERHGPAPGEGRATVMLLHGLGRNAADAWRMLAPALPDDVTVVVPQGPFEGPDQPAGRAWFSVKFSEGGPIVDMAQADRSRKIIVALAEATKAKLPVGQPLISLGFSQGAIVALDALLERPDLFAASVIATGRLLDGSVDRNPPTKAHEGKPLYWCHGQNDAFIPLFAAESSHACLAPYNFSLRTVVHQAGHDLPIDVAENIRKWISEVLADGAEKTP